ncbi:MAG: hypothetical protein J7M08_00850 [Planctomycetes bacterium]|nr:hypothetical protein [Planctomycetota bacterium]
MLVGARQLGKIIQCSRCKRYLRVGLQFLLVDKSLAPNLTVQCQCAHFVVAKPESSGKRVRCPVCKRYLMLPEPVMKFDSPGCLRVPRKALKKQLKQPTQQRERPAKEMSRLELAAHAGRINLRPGEHICTNLRCGALLKAGTIVCPECGTNHVSGERYEPLGPQEDPKGVWKQV